MYWWVIKCLSAYVDEREKETNKLLERTMEVKMEGSGEWLVEGRSTATGWERNGRDRVKGEI